ncbi:hypothetical protein B0O80DRAFT_453929 [Mortierella sp. GBAus27b]|nr:hypothetical protein B0O80DRAFT_453929 [Mortierella sp. GBAus27b]
MLFSKSYRLDSGAQTLPTEHERDQQTSYRPSVHDTLLPFWEKLGVELGIVCGTTL